MTTNTIKKDISILSTLTDAEKVASYESLWTFLSSDDKIYDYFKFLRRESSSETGQVPFEDRNMQANLFELYKNYIDDILPNESVEMEEQAVQEDAEYVEFKKTQPSYINSQVLNVDYEMDHIKKSIHIYDEETTKALLEFGGLSDDPCISIQGNVKNSKFIEDIQVFYHSNIEGNDVEAAQFPLGDLLDDPYSFENFRFILEEVENESEVADEISILVTFIDGTKIMFEKSMSEFEEINEQLRLMWKQNKLN